MNSHDDNAADPFGVLLQMPLPADAKPTAEHVACVQQLVSQRAIPARPVRVRYRREILSVAAIVLALAGIVFLAPKKEETTAADEWLNTEKFTPAPDWVRMKTVETINTLNPPEIREYDTWLSSSLGVQISTSVDSLHFADVKNKYFYTKYAKQSLIYRAPMTSQKVIDNANARIAEIPFASPISNRSRVKQESSRLVEIDGSVWIEKSFRSKAQDQKWTAVYWYEPTTGRANRAIRRLYGDDSYTVSMDFTYPPTGPATLAALGCDGCKIVEGLPPSLPDVRTEKGFGEFMDHLERVIGKNVIHIFDDETKE